MITRDDALAWKHSEVTKEHVRELHRIREDIKEELATGVYVAGTYEATAILITEAVTKCTMLQDMIDEITHVADKYEEDSIEEK